MIRYLITPTLHGSWQFYRSAEHTSKTDFLNTLNKVPFTQSENMLKGIALEDAAVSVARGNAIIGDADWLQCVTEIAEEIKGGLFQERVYREECIGGYNVLLYGLADCIRRSWAKDIKFTENYEVGKYSDKIQHLLYMYCAGLPDFRYLISNGRSVWFEDYHATQRGVEDMFGTISEMLYDIMSDADFREAFNKNWGAKP